MQKICVTIITLLAIAVFSGSTPELQASSNVWKSGLNYELIEPPQATRTVSPRIEVVEAFWYSCPHCNALEPDINRWLRAKPEYIQFVRIPVTWDVARLADARLYYILMALHRTDLHEEVFRAIHLTKERLHGNSPTQTYQLQWKFAHDHGINEKDFRSAYNSKFVETSLRDADRLTRAYHIAGVPSLVVNGRYSTDLDEAGSTDNLFAIVNFLAKSEHDSALTVRK